MFRLYSCERKENLNDKRGAGVSYICDYNDGLELISNIIKKLKNNGDLIMCDITFEKNLPNFCKDRRFFELYDDPCGNAWEIEKEKDVKEFGHKKAIEIENIYEYITLLRNALEPKKIGLGVSEYNTFILKGLEQYRKPFVTTLNFNGIDMIAEVVLGIYEIPDGYTLYCESKKELIIYDDLGKSQEFFDDYIQVFRNEKGDILIRLLSHMDKINLEFINNMKG